MQPGVSTTGTEAFSDLVTEANSTIRRTEHMPRQEVRLQSAATKKAEVSANMFESTLDKANTRHLHLDRLKKLVDCVHLRLESQW